MGESAQRARLRIHGRVQGVFYRAHAERQAGALGLSGWVRNRPDGSVEALVEGPANACDRFVAWCERGSPGADVERVEVERSEASGELDGFHIRH